MPLLLIYYGSFFANIVIEIVLVIEYYRHVVIHTVVSYVYVKIRVECDLSYLRNT